MMMMTKKQQRTPSRIMADLIKVCMLVKGMQQKDLAKAAHVSENTVSSDLKEPEKMTQYRMWLYFAIIGIDMTEVLHAAAHRVADGMIER